MEIRVTFAKLKHVTFHTRLLFFFLAVVSCGVQKGVHAARRTFRNGLAGWVTVFASYAVNAALRAQVWRTFTLLAYFFFKIFIIYWHLLYYSCLDFLLISFCNSILNLHCNFIGYFLWHFLISFLNFISDYFNCDRNLLLIVFSLNSIWMFLYWNDYVL